MVSVAREWRIFALSVDGCPNIAARIGKAVTAKRIPAISSAGIWGLVALSAEGCPNIVCSIDRGIAARRISVGNIRDRKTSGRLVGIAC